MTRRRLLLHTTIYSAVDLTNAVVLLAVLPLWAAWLQPAEFGIFDTLRGTSKLVGAMLGAGLAAALTRHAPSDAPPRFADRYTSLQRTQLVLLALAGLLGEWMGPTLLPRLLDGVTWTHHGRPMLWAAMAIAGYHIHQSMLVYRQRPVVTSFGALGATLIAVGVGTVALGVGPRVASPVLWAFVCSATAAWLLFARCTRHERAGGHLRLSDGRAALLYGAPVIPHIASQYALVFADRYVIASDLGNAAVGNYGLAYVPASALAIGCLALNKAYMPQMYALFNAAREGQRDALGQPLMRLMLGWSALVVAGTIAAVLLGPLALKTIAVDGYEIPSIVPILLCIGVGLHGLYLVHVNILFYYARTRRLAVLSLVAATVNLGLNVWWIPEMGLAGAAWATTAAYALLLLLVSGAGASVVLAQRRQSSAAVP